MNVDKMCTEKVIHLVLTELRKLYRISMQDLSNSINVSKPLIGQIEKGTRAITEEVLSKLVEYFGLSREITDDYRKFFTKESMDDIEILKVKKAKIEKEAEDIEYEYTDPYTGDTYIRHDSTLDIEHYISTEYDIKRKELIRKIENRLEGIINSSIEDHEKNDGYASIEQAISEASDKVSFYDKLINLDAKVDPYIYQRIVRALTLVTGKGIDSDPFTRKLVKLISTEIEKKEKERLDNLKLYNEIFGEHGEKSKDLE